MNMAHSSNSGEHRDQSGNTLCPMCNSDQVYALKHDETDDIMYWKCEDCGEQWEAE